MREQNEVEPMECGNSVAIHYRRLPNRDEMFTQTLVDVQMDCVVTLLEAASIATPMRINGQVVLDPDSPIVWHTYPGKWHDIGRFHRSDGIFTGYYANVLTPVRMDGAQWFTTDLCLDVWYGADGRVELLDEEDFAEAVNRGWIDARTEHRARMEAEDLLRSAHHGAWPPAEVHQWTLQSARDRLRAARP